MIGENELGLLQVKMQNKEEMYSVILQGVKESPNKTQFNVIVGMIEISTMQDGDNGNYETHIDSVLQRNSWGPLLDTD